MKNLIPTVGWSILLLGSLPAGLLIAEPSQTQGVGYTKELVSMSETLEYGSAKLVQTRDVINIAPEFGKLIAVLRGGEGVVMWFENEKGQIRNVTFSDIRPLIVRRKGRLVPGE